jgi:hypothetical protein
MKVNEVIKREASPNYGDDPKLRQFASMGRTLMDLSAKMKITKDTPDSEIDKSNKMAAFGDALTRFGTSWGPKNATELCQQARCTGEEAKEFIALAKKAGPVKVKGNDVEPEDEPEDDMGGPDDDEIARQADMVARGR